MASILDRLPHTGHGVVFSGRVGAVRLPDGRQLLISAGGTESFGQAAEPVDNWRTGPDERHPARRPSYMHAFPLSYAPSAVRLAKAKDPWPWASGPWAGGEHDWTSLALLLWRRRDTPDDYVRQDPYTGGAIRVCQALRQTALAGSQAVALSYQLRFGDFDGDSEAMYQLAKTVEGMSDAAEMFELPFVAGELAGDEGLGLHPQVKVIAHPLPAQTAARAGRKGDVILLAGRLLNDISGSLLLAVHGVTESFPPAIDLVAELRAQELVLQALRQGLIRAALDCRRGGLLITLAQCCAAWGQGARVTAPSRWQHLSPAAFLFGEGQSRFVISASEDRVAALLDIARTLDVPLVAFGNLGGDAISFSGLVDIPVATLQSLP